VIVQFAGAVTADHERPIVVEEFAVAARFVGAAGTALHVGADAAKVSALTCVDATELPYASTASTT
jgi:hypothetical protein